MEKLKNSVLIPVVDHEGNLLEMRKIRNCPIAELHNDMLNDIILVDWLGSTRQRPDVERINQPVTYRGKTYYANKYWGSAVKTGTTIGVTEAFLDKVLVKKAEDGQRVQRYLFGQGHWGGVIGENIRVRIIPEGTVTQWGLVADGAGFISRRLADAGYNGLNKIRLGRARESYTFWQRVKWSEELETEIAPLLKEAVESMSDVSKILTKYSPASYDEKRELYYANNRMQMHPYLVNAIARSSGEMLARVATTASVGSKVAVAVPTRADCVIPKHLGKAIIYRYPIDSEGSMQATKATKKEQKEVENAEVIQHTLSGEIVVDGERQKLFGKGTFRIVDTNEFDILVCAEDIKMVGGNLETVRKLFETLFDGVIVFNQWFNKGCAVGVSPSFGKKQMGLDYDGDLVNWINGDKHPILWKTIKDQPEAYTEKLEKSSTGLSNRGNMIYKSMMNLVGMATKMATDSYMMQDREYFAHEMGFKSLRSMDRELNYWIKVGTDGFKTDIDQEPIRTAMSIYQSKVQNMLGGSAPYSSWPNTRAFARFVPQIFFKGMDEDEAKESIRPHMDATIGQICRKTLPHLENLIGEPFRAEPLSAFRAFVPYPSDMYMNSAKKLQDWFNARQNSVNWADTEEIYQFKSEWHEQCDEAIAEKGLYRYKLAEALWYVAHSSRSEDSGGASVFMEFHPECVKIVKEMPGNNDAFETMLTGLDYQLPDVDNMAIDVEVVNIEVVKKNRRFVRKALVAVVKGQQQPQGDYPENMIAMVALNANQPSIGKYRAEINRYSEKAHMAILTEA